jgi:RHS repeat-associated protein
MWSSVLGEPVVELTSGGVYRAYVYGPGGGQMIAMQSYDGAFYWLHTDHLGSGRKITNTSGTVVYRGEFDPHGQALYEWHSSGQTYLNSHKYTGYERDWATNLNYAKARTYHHNRGRFMQPDPLGLGAADLTDPQSLNRYSYVGNDPVNFVDPTGLLMMFCEARIIGQTFIEGIGDAPVFLITCEIYGGGGYYQPIGGGGGGGEVGGGGGGLQAQGQNQQNNLPCGVNPITGQPGFTESPRGVPGNLRPGVGGQGNFGARRRRGGGHHGLDISGVSGVSLIYASQGGTVTNAGSEPRGYGNWIEIDHGTYSTRYAHNFENYVGVGDNVVQGQIIATVGQTGNAAGQRATEAHVHFEVRSNATGAPSDPAAYLNITCNWQITQPNAIPTNWPIRFPW